MRKRIASLFGLVMALLGALLLFGPQHPQIVAAQFFNDTATTETIAYVVGDNTTGDQIWLIEPDKSNNRKIYQTGVPDEHNADFMTSLAWRPDAGELVFTSNHEEYCSWYNYDVYAILPDGSGYRRVTNSPACAGLASFPQGVVTLGTAAVPYDAEVYIQGAPMLKSAFGSSVTFDKVADFGSQAQPIVAVHGLDRWLGPTVDVIAGQTVGPTYASSTSIGTDEIGAFNPVWKSDGSRLGYTFGCAQLYGIQDHPAPGTWGQPLMNQWSISMHDGLGIDPKQSQPDRLFQQHRRSGYLSH